MPLATGLQFHYVITNPKVGEQHILTKYCKFENFNYLNVAFISYKLTMWDSMLFSDGHKAYGQRLRKKDIYAWS